MVHLCGVKKSFRQGPHGLLPVLRNINFHAPGGKTTVLIGPSGAGKSTMLRCVNLLEIPDEGVLRVAGKEIRFEKNENHPPLGKSHFVRQQEILALRRHTGMVFQNFQLFPHKTVLENIMEGPVLVKKENPNEARDFALALLEKVEMSDKKDSYPSTLSGGQQQRAAIARALGMRPDVLLFDEPTSALDPELEREVLKVIRTLVQENNTMIIVTHNLIFAREVADFIAFLDGGEVVAYGTPAEIFSKIIPKRVGDFITAMSPEDYRI
ncbi:MAG: amino acid ABC transporter ATP-binding protein [Spirochaetaceae bacterium]|jgi:cystine transport system ATP-binding protein|nr:amino acid ABC transporter ATP-binding protein [Spirochaetaceae bacterium]